MASNPYVNKVVFGNDTLIDLTSDTVSTGVLLSGYTAHDATGAQITGGIQYKTGLDLTFYWDDYGTYRVNIPSGAYSAGALAIFGVQIEPPTSGTNSFYIDFPNNSAPVSENDWTRVTFTVDSNGNSNISDVAISANGVSF